MIVIRVQVFLESTWFEYLGIRLEQIFFFSVIFENDHTVIIETMVVYFKL